MNAILMQHRPVSAADCPVNAMRWRKRAFEDRIAEAISRPYLAVDKATRRIEIHRPYTLTFE
jgi:hypothetical protein